MWTRFAFRKPTTELLASLRLAGTTSFPVEQYRTRMQSTSLLHGPTRNAQGARAVGMTTLALNQRMIPRTEAASNVGGMVPGVAGLREAAASSPQNSVMAVSEVGKVTALHLPPPASR
jgi:hypothetical protein